MLEIRNPPRPGAQVAVWELTECGLYCAKNLCRLGTDYHTQCVPMHHTQFLGGAGAMVQEKGTKGDKMVS